MKNSSIIEAINNKQKLEIYYDGGVRIVEPYCYGNGTSGNDLLRAFQTNGYSKSGEPTGWKLMITNEMKNIEILDEIFEHNNSQYKRNDKAMRTIYAQI